MDKEDRNYYDGQPDDCGGNYPPPHHDPCECEPPRCYDPCSAHIYPEEFAQPVEINPSHGWVFFPPPPGTSHPTRFSRASFLINQEILTQFMASEMEGTKNFPYSSMQPLVWYDHERELFGAPFPDSNQFAADEGVTPRVIPDGVILSGGRTDIRNLVNLPDDELFRQRGLRWPVQPVTPGGQFV